MQAVFAYITVCRLCLLTSSPRSGLNSNTSHYAGCIRFFTTLRCCLLTNQDYAGCACFCTTLRCCLLTNMMQTVHAAFFTKFRSRLKHITLCRQCLLLHHLQLFVSELKHITLCRLCLLLHHVEVLYLDQHYYAGSACFFTTFRSCHYYAGCACFWTTLSEELSLDQHIMQAVLASAPR